MEVYLFGMEEQQYVNDAERIDSDKEQYVSYVLEGRLLKNRILSRKVIFDKRFCSFSGMNIIDEWHQNNDVFHYHIVLVRDIQHLVNEQMMMMLIYHR